MIFFTKKWPISRNKKKIIIRSRNILIFYSFKWKNHSVRWFAYLVRTLYSNNSENNTYFAKGLYEAGKIRSEFKCHQREFIKGVEIGKKI